MRTTRTTIYHLLLCVAAALAALPVCADGAGGSSGLEAGEADAPVTWHLSLEDAVLEAQSEYKSILLFATMPGCGYCRVMKERVFPLPGVQEQLRRFVLFELNTVVEPELARELGIRGVPVTAVLTSDGMVQDRVVGYMNEEETKAFIARALNEEIREDPLESIREETEALEEGGLSDEGWDKLLKGLGQPAARDHIRSSIRNLSSFPSAPLVNGLKSPALEVRMASLELLEEAAGDDFGFTPWASPESEHNREALERWKAWERSGESRLVPAYSSLTREDVERCLDDLVAGGRTRRNRARKMLQYGDASAEPVIRGFLAEKKDLLSAARKRVEEALYTVMLPDGRDVTSASLAHRLVVGTLDTRMRAVRKLGDFGLPGRQILEEMLLDPQPLIRETAVEVLTKMKDVSVIPSLEELVGRETKIEVLISTARGLAKIKSKKGLELLGRLSKHSDEDVVIEALQGMASLGSRRIEEEVNTCLADKRWRVRVAALSTAGKLKLSSAKEAAEALLEDPDPFVRYHAVMAYTQIAEDQAVDRLEELFVSQDDMKASILSAWCSLDEDIPGDMLTSLEAVSAEISLACLQALEDCGKKGLALAGRLAAHENIDVSCTALKVIAGEDDRSYEDEQVLVKALAGGRPEQVRAVLMNLKNKVKEDASNEDLAFDLMLLDLASEEESGLLTLPSEAGNESTNGAFALDDLFADFSEPASEVSSPSVSVSAGKEAPEQEGDPLALMELFEDFSDDAEGSAAENVSSLAEAILPYLSEREDEQVRLQAALVMLDFRNTDGLGLLQDNLSMLGESQRRTLARRMGWIKPEEAVGLLRTLLNDRSESVRQAAAEALKGALHLPGWADTLFEVLAEKETRLTPDEVYGYRFTVTPSSKKAVRAWLKKHLEDPEISLELKRFALVLLETVWSKEDTSLVLEWASHGDDLVRRAAWHALLVNSGADFQAHVETIANDPSYRVRQVLTQAFADDEGNWIHHFAQGKKKKHYHVGYSNNRRSKLRYDEAARSLMQRLAEDDSPVIRAEAMVTQLEQGDEIDVARLVSTLDGFTDVSSIGSRIAALIQKRYRQWGVEHRGLLPYLKHTWLSTSEEEKIRAHFQALEVEGNDLSAAEHVALRSAPSGVTPEPGASEPPSELELAPIYAAFFSDPGCEACERVELWFKMLNDVFPELKVETYVIHKESSRVLNEALSEQFDVSSDKVLETPAVFAGGGCLVGEEITFDTLGELVARSMGSGFSPAAVADAGGGEVDLPQRVSEPSSQGAVAHAEGGRELDRSVSRSRFWIACLVAAAGLSVFVLRRKIKRGE